MASKKIIALIILIVFISSFPVSAISISSGLDKLSVYASSDGVKWNLVTSPTSISLTVPKTYKIALESGKNAIGGVYIQLLPQADMIIRADYTGKTVEFVQYNSEKYEYYYAYGGSSLTPWVVLWQVYPKTNVLVYSDFTKKKVHVVPVTSKWIATYISGPITNGKIPSLVDIEVVTGE